MPYKVAVGCSVVLVGIGAMKGKIQETYLTSHSEIPGKNSSSRVRSVSLIKNGMTPR